MKRAVLPRVSLEAISYQGRSLLYFDLVAILDNIRFVEGLNQRLLESSGLAAMIKRRTGMSVNLVLTTGANDDGGFYAEPPVLDADNPYYKLLSKLSSDETRKDRLDHFQRAVRLAQNTTGWVNLKAGRVEGVFGQLTTTLYISTKVLQDRSFTSEELAAKSLHELGHIFSFFETLLHTSATNMVVTTAVEALAETDKEPERIKLISTALGAFGMVDQEAVKLISDSTSDTTQRLLFLKTFEEGERIRLQQMSNRNDVYNLRSIEFMADQFAVRHGAAVALANAQHKMNMRSRTDYGASTTAFLAFQATRYALLGALAYVVPPAGLIVGLVASLLQAAEVVNDDINPDPIERLARMKGDLVQLLKNTSLSPKLRQQLLKDVEALDALRANVKDHSGLFRFLWRNISPVGRRRSKLREMQKGLEDLINNDLFTYAARLREQQ